MIGLINVVYCGATIAQTDDTKHADLIVRTFSKMDDARPARWEFSESQEAKEYFARAAVSVIQSQRRFDTDTLARIGHCLFGERTPSINDLGEVWCGDEYLGKGAEKTISFDTDFPNS
jgi:hypothetical protein